MTAVLAVVFVAIHVANAENRLESAATYRDVTCDGFYEKHLQGIETNQKDAIFWSFTTKLIKTDVRGRILKQIDVADHHGDLCWCDGQIYVAVNLGPFNLHQGADSYVYAYDGDSLSKTAEFKIPDVRFGAGGIEYHNGHFWVVGGLPPGEIKNYLYEYDSSFNLVRAHELVTGYTDRGIQTATFADGHWWFGTYHEPPPDSAGSGRQLIQFDEPLMRFRVFRFDASLGLAPIAEQKLLVGRNRRVQGKGWVGYAELVEPDTRLGLRTIPVTADSRSQTSP